MNDNPHFFGGGDRLGYEEVVCFYRVGGLSFYYLLVIVKLIYKCNLFIGPLSINIAML